ncbi:hypothetical protein DQ04_06261050 [Trypanosoma grayi]|uniref:hypothetical protein n=1 Tax=Trypanosoma grayi TaxID=71804 RepID=UPI0004F4908F|nr:hypothetical protein DQ04_06261050 [Trypanosoma grayi]KEG08881.1 hypothetical protein DQ04_06261050 [Trypanosoma grayi]
MGGTLCCCCCYFDDCVEARTSTPHRRQHSRAPPSNAFLGRYGIWRPEGPAVCDVCGRTLDPALLDGHREACRANVRRKMQQAPPLPNLAVAAATTTTATTATAATTAAAAAVEGGNEDMCDGEELCVVCMEARRLYAFLPCGHVSCCGECAKALDTCPICREPRRALCRVTSDALLQFKCPHCNNIIAPELCDGHREVCALRARVELMGREAEGGAADPPPPSTALVVRDPRGRDHRAVFRYCIACQNAERPLMITVPCGHRVLCEVCVAGRTTCPVCLGAISDVLRSFV